MDLERYDRNLSFFGVEGQQKLRAATVAVVGIGGVGTHVVQQLALLGVGALKLIDAEELDRTNFNRYVGIRHSDAVPGTRKVDIGERMVHEIDPTITVTKILDSVVSPQGFAAVRETDYVFGCVDREGIRFILTELCAAHRRPYFDVASEILPGDRLSYGGRVCVAWDGNGCLACLEELDQAEVAADLQEPAVQRDREAIYGVRRHLLGGGGPSVVSINGVVASLAVTEFMLGVTGIRSPQRLLKYYGETGKVVVRADGPQPDCPCCKGIYGLGAEADVDRYVRAGVGDWLRQRPGAGEAAG